MEIKEAFDFLTSAAQAEFDKAQKASQAYIVSGQIEQARQANKQVEKMIGLLEGIQLIRGQFESVGVPPSRRRNQIAGPRRGERTAEGILTPQSRYWLPILQAMVDSGGSGPTHLIIDRVGELMDGILNRADKGHTQHSHEPRWRNRTRWARQDMMEEGLVNDQTPDGTWAITDKGREYLKNRMAQGEH